MAEVTNAVIRAVNALQQSRIRVAAHWYVAPDRDALQTGNRPGALEQCIDEDAATLRVVHAGRERNPRDLHVFRGEARIDLQDLLKAAEHEAGADQDEEGEGDLAGDEDLLRAYLPARSIPRDAARTRRQHRPRRPSRKPVGRRSG